MKRRSKELSVRTPLGDPDPWEAAWLKCKQAKAARKAEQEARPLQKEEIRGPALIRGLEYAFEMTGDPLFRDAQSALISYQLDQKLMQRGPDVYNKLMGLTEIAWYRRMRHEIRYLRARRRAVERASEDGFIGEAAARVCSTPEFPQGQSFGADVEKLRRGYSNWVNEKCPSELDSAPDGNLGRLVWVMPKNGKPVQIGSYHIPAEGAARPDDLFLRRLFMEGVILIGRYDTQPM